MTLDFKSLHAEESYSLLITDILGKVVYKKTLYKKTQVLDLSHLQKGIYMLTLKNTTQRISKKLVLY
ncbi:MAG: T9SS type A sorting domain-containing protein [Bizionia paragorgiae]|uniref:T9SS type A sorting domain-containing protein n=1 Tax=Bizionia paragorgiae TaxID=283786 RepID=UPI003C47AFB4